MKTKLMIKFHVSEGRRIGCVLRKNLPQFLNSPTKVAFYCIGMTAYPGFVHRSRTKTYKSP